MRPPSDERPDAAGPSDTPGAIRDRRTIPRGVLPRHVQMWLMVAIAVVIIACFYAFSAFAAGSTQMPTIRRL